MEADTISPVVTAKRPGWTVVLANEDRVTEHSTTHHRWCGVFSVHRTTLWGRVEYFISLARADTIYTYNCNSRWEDGRLVLVPYRFRNGRPRPVHKRSPCDVESFAEAEHLIRASGWEA